MSDVASSAWPSRGIERLVLCKHHLTEETLGRDERDIVRITGDVGGLHAQSFETPYYSLWNRMRKFEWEWLDGLLGRKLLIAAHLMRVTLHIVPAEEFPMYFKATRDAMGRFLRGRGYSWPPKLTKIHQAILDFVGDRREATTLEIREHLEARGLPIMNLHRTIHYELGGIGAILRSQRTPKVPTQWKWSTTESMIGRSSLESVAEEEAKEWLVQKYLKAFGPSSIDDITSYTWHTKTETKRIIERLIGKGEVANIKIDTGNHLWVLSQDIERLRELEKENRTGEEPNHIHVLPEFDPLTVGLRRRWKTLIAVPPIRQGLRGHPAPGVILVDGQILGKCLTWPGLSLFLDARGKELAVIKAIVKKLEDMARLKHMQVLCIRKIDGEERIFVESKPILDYLFKAGYSLCQEGLCKQLS